MDLVDKEKHFANKDRFGVGYDKWSITHKFVEGCTINWIHCEEAVMWYFLLQMWFMYCQCNESLLLGTRVEVSNLDTCPSVGSGKCWNFTCVWPKISVQMSILMSKCWVSNTGTRGKIKSE